MSVIFSAVFYLFGEISGLSDYQQGNMLALFFYEHE